VPLWISENFCDQLSAPSDTAIKLTCNGKKPMPTIKLAVQLTATARLVAAPRADWLNNSDTRNQGMDPGPIANIMTNRMTSRILTYDTHKAASWNTKYVTIKQIKNQGKILNCTHNNPAKMQPAKFCHVLYFF
jgi:hypothetical protein